MHSLPRAAPETATANARLARQQHDLCFTYFLAAPPATQQKFNFFLAPD